MKKTPEQKAFWDDLVINCPDTKESIIGYKNYLKTKHWKLKRIEIFRRDNHTCQRCGKTLALSRANIHHKTYEHIGNEWNEDLILLCHDCHEAVHGRTIKRRPKKTWKEKTTHLK